ncbi:MAG: ABC transporter permease [Acidobacteriaceae bacterium]|nr:ABC transporter permease [Acidobacteriaceae bacterium]
MNIVSFFESAWQDFRYAARLFRLNKGFFAIATLSLALGIGANTAIFQLLDAVRLRMLPLSHPEELVELKIAKNEHCCSGNFSDRRPNFTYAQWDQIRERQQAFSNIFAWGDMRFNLTEGGEVQYAEGLWVTGDFFKTLRIQPLFGRLLTSGDDRPGCGLPGAVISYGFWQRQFGGDRQVLGKTVSLDGHRLPVVGVTPANFFGVEVGRNFDVAVPVCAEPLINGEESHLAKRHHWWLAIIGRLKPGWTIARATAQAQAISSQVFGNTVPPNYRADEAKYYAAYKLTALPAGSGVSGLRRQYEEPLWLLLGIAGLVLLIACSNLANLMLARASNREREMAVRLAVGADRGRLIRQLLAESLLLTFVGAALGALLAQFLSRYVVAFLTTGDNPLFIELAPDWRVLAFTAAVAILTCILFGLTPALRATRTVPASAMKASGRGLAGDRQRLGLRRGLVISQIALSLMLLVGALLFVRRLFNLLTLDAGFRENGLLVSGIDISRLNFSPPRRAAFYRGFIETVRSIPGIEQAASASIVQVSGNGWNDSIEFLDKRAGKRMTSWFDSVSPGYFRTMGTPLLAGRDFDDRDTPASTEVAIVNEQFSKKFLGGASPLGRQFRILSGPGEPQHVYQIVGVVKNSKYQTLRDDFEPIVFVAESQDKEPGLGTNIIVRSALPIGSLTAAIKRTVLRENAGTSLEFHVFKTQIRESLLRERLMATLSAFFGFLAAVLATVGLYGVISYMVERRRNEIGIRIALGANRRTVINLVMKEASLLLTAGFIIGVVLAMASARTASSLLYGLRPADPLSIGFAAVLLGIVSLTASFVPALRASQVEPMTALREE